MPRNCFPILKRLFIFLILLLLMTGQVCAVEIPDELVKRFGLEELLDAVPKQARQLSEDSQLQELSFGELLSLTPKQFFAALGGEWSRTVSEYRGAFLSLLGLVLLFSVVHSVCSGSFSEEAAGCLFSVFAVLLIGDAVGHAVGRTAETLHGAARFLTAYVPVYAAVLTASGSPATASFYHVAVLGGSQMIGTAVNTGLVPLCCIFFNLCVAESFAGDIFPKWSAAVKKTVCWLLVLLVTVFVGVLSLQSVLTGAADGASVKTAKFIVGTFVPVIGSAVSDAVQAAQGSLRIIRAAAGSFGVVVTALTFLPALVEVLLLRLGLGAVSVLSDLLSCGALTSVLKSTGQLLSILTALLLTMGLLMIVSTAVVLSAGGAP